MTNETNKPLAETKQLRGTFDQVIRQINETYNASNGWAIARTSSVLVNFSVWLERSVKQAPSKGDQATNLEVTDGVYKSETHEKDVAEAQVETQSAKTVAKRTTTKK